MNCPRCNKKMYGVDVPGGSSATEREQSSMVMVSAMKCPNCHHYVWDEPVVVMPTIPPPSTPQPKRDCVYGRLKHEAFRAMVLENYALIEDMRANKKTWRDISKHMKKLGVSASYTALNNHFTDIGKERIEMAKKNGTIVRDANTKTYPLSAVTEEAEQISVEPIRSTPTTEEKAAVVAKPNKGVTSATAAPHALDIQQLLEDALRAKVAAWSATLGELESRLTGSRWHIGISPLLMG